MRDRYSAPISRAVSRMRGVRWMSANFIFLAGTICLSKLEGSRLIGGLGHFNGLQKPKSNPIRDSPNFSPFGGQHRPPALRFVQFTAPSRHGRACPRPSTSFPTGRARR